MAVESRRGGRPRDQRDLPDPNQCESTTREGGGLKRQASTRRTGRARFLYALGGVALLSVGAAALFVGRERLPVVLPVPEVARATGPGRPVIFVGLDGGDWELLDGYAAAGVMPNLAALVREGGGGTLFSLHPPLSPLVWTTMMTGVGPLEHRILDFTRRSPRDGREEPITSDERRVPAVWNMATYGGKRVAVFGLWATYPSEEVNGLVVSDRAFPILLADAEAAPQLVHPPRRLEWVRKALQKAEESVGFSELQSYLPWLDEGEFRRLVEGPDAYAHPVSALRRILVETRLHHELATDSIRRDRPDLAVVYLQGTDSMGHLFAPFAPPPQPSVPEADYVRYHRVPEVFFHYVDELLGDYRRLAERSGAVLVLASDHGFRWAEGRPTQVSSVGAATAAAWHRAEGMYLMWGPGIAAAPGHPHQGSVEQVAATLLALLGLPPMPGGSALPGVAASTRPSVNYAAYYRPPPPAVSATVPAEALEKLRALGYVGGAATSAGHGGTAPSSPDDSRTAGSYANESLILRLAGREAEAIAAAERSLALDPKQTSALWSLSDLIRGREPERSDELLVGAFAQGLPLGIEYVAARAEQYQRAGQAMRARRLLAATVEARPTDAEVWRARGRHLVDAGDCAAAVADLERAVRFAPGDRRSQAALGLARLCSGDDDGAREVLAAAHAPLGEAHRTLAEGALLRGDLARAEREARRAMAQEGSKASGALVLARVELGRRRPERALEALAAARESVSPVPPPLNLELLRGEALARLGRGREAEDAFRAEIAAHPGNAVAYERLARVLALLRRPRDEIRSLLQSMYEASPRRETAARAAQVLAFLGDTEGATRWQRRATLADRRSPREDGSQ